MPIGSITFSVSEIKKNDQIHSETQDLTKDLSRWTLTGEQLSLENFQINHPLAKNLNGKNDRVKNAFIATVFTAYSHHYPLELSVEDIWVTITQGIGIHLNENAEKYRQIMVSHEGKKNLEVIVDNLRISDSARPENGDQSIPAIDWTAVVRLMGQLIKEDMKTDLATILTTPFSNTTIVEQAVFDCTLMDTVKSYYSFECMLTCGLPQVTLRGSPEDFQQVIDRVNQLRDIFMDLHWWLDSILPHLKKLKTSAEGNPDIEWWTKICHRAGGSGTDQLSGWIADFIPYILHGDGHYRRTRKNHYSRDGMNRIELTDFSEAVTRTDFILNDNGYKTEMKFIAGFLGIGQNPETGALRPCLGWITTLPKEKNTNLLLKFFREFINNIFFLLN